MPGIAHSEMDANVARAEIASIGVDTAIEYTVVRTFVGEPHSEARPDAIAIRFHSPQSDAEPMSPRRCLVQQEARRAMIICNHQIHRLLLSTSPNATPRPTSKRANGEPAAAPVSRNREPSL